LDLGKAVAALMTNTGDVYDYLEIVGKGLPITNKPVPLIAVPTTSGTGSECTKNAVLKSSEHGRKASMRHDSMLPAIAVIDPCLSVSCPQQVLHCTDNLPDPFFFPFIFLPFLSHHFPSSPFLSSSLPSLMPSLSLSLWLYCSPSTVEPP
jgi:Iron-containing alcohol dehydrogenase